MLLALTTLNGCGFAISGRPDSCAGFRPIFLQRADVLTGATEGAIIAHNELGERVGCWKARP